MSVAGRVLLEPGMRGRFTIALAPPEWCRTSRASRVLPFGFAGQPIRGLARRRMFSTNFGVQPCDVSFRILPIDAQHWVAIGLIEAEILPTNTRLLDPFAAVMTTSISRWILRLADERRIFAARHVVLAQRE